MATSGDQKLAVDLRGEGRTAFAAISAGVDIRLNTQGEGGRDPASMGLEDAIRPRPTNGTPPIDPVLNVQQQ